jgi:hypothetical protein
MSTQTLTLKNVLSDPMVRLAMEADRVDPQELATMLNRVARTLERSQPKASVCSCA